VGIDLHHHLLHNRRNTVRQRFDNPFQRLAFRAWLWAMRSPARYRIAAWAGRFAGPFLKPWTQTRDFPSPARESFRDYWRKHERGT
jgi:L-lactate dehydrogenase complex protein LldF